MDKVQSRLSLYMSYMQRCNLLFTSALTASPVTEGWALFHYVYPASKSNDLTKGKGEKGRGNWKQSGGKGTEEEQVLRQVLIPQQIILPGDWQKCFSPTLKTYLAMGLESVWLWTWSCGQVTDVSCGKVVGRAALQPVLFFEFLHPEFVF